MRPLEANGLHRRHREPGRDAREVCGQHEIGAALDHLELAAQRARRPAEVGRRDDVEHNLGRSSDVERDRPERPDPAMWRECREYLRGIDLFNYGYYWEAHEVWECLWHACGRQGPTSEFLKALIRL